MTTATGTLLNYANDTNGRRTDGWFATNAANTMRGNRLTATDGTTPQTLTFNAANLITTSGYTYDTAGNQTGKPGPTTHASNAACQTISSTYDGVGTPQALTTSAGADHFCLPDGLGSPTALVNTRPTQTSTYTYDRYGAYTDTNISGLPLTTLSAFGLCE